MSHIHTLPGQHDHTVSCYIVRLDGNEPLIWLHMHKNLGRLLPAGGHIELDETPWDAAVHEILEESGYSIHDLQILQPKDRLKSLEGVRLHPQPVAVSTQKPEKDHFHVDSAYVFIAHGEPSNTIAAGESNDIRWLTRAELENLDISKDIFTNTKEIYRYILDHCVDAWEKVSPDAYPNNEIMV